MVLLSLSVFPFLVFLRCHRVLGQVLQNRTVGDNDPMIHYTGGWNKSAFSKLDEGGLHMLTQDPNARAVFEFTGVAIYFLSPLWPYDVTTQVQLDSRSPELLVLKDYHSPGTDGGWETVMSQIIWAARGLEDGRHTLTITVGAGEEWAVVDAFIVTWVNGSITPTQSPSRSTSAPTVTSTVNVTKTTTASSDPSPSSSRSRGVNVLAVGLVSGIGALVLVIIVLLCYICRHQSQVLFEEDIPLIPGSPPVLSIPPWTPTSSITSPTSLTMLLHTPDEEQYAMIPLVPWHSRNASTSNWSMGTVARQTIPDKPPPGYDESVSAYRRARRSTLRKSRLVLRNTD